MIPKLLFTELSELLINFSNNSHFACFLDTAGNIPRFNAVNILRITNRQKELRYTRQWSKHVEIFYILHIQ